MSKWDERFIGLARHVAQWSKDPSTQVGAVLVRPDRTVASVGFNGFARRVEDSKERYADRPTKYEMIVHAELNALLNTRESIEGYTLYVTPLPPCAQCTAALIQRGIGKVVLDRSKTAETWDEKFEISRTMLAEAGVALVVSTPAEIASTPTLTETEPTPAAAQ